MRILSNAYVYFELWTYKWIWWEAPSLKWSCLDDFIVSLYFLLFLYLNYRHWSSTNIPPSKVMLKHRMKIIETITKTFHNSWTQSSERKTNFTVVFYEKLQHIQVPFESKGASAFVSILSSNPLGLLCFLMASCPLSLV